MVSNTKLMAIPLWYAPGFFNETPGNKPPSSSTKKHTFVSFGNALANAENALPKGLCCLISQKMSAFGGNPVPKSVTSKSVTSKSKSSKSEGGVRP